MPSVTHIPTPEERAWVNDIVRDTVIDAIKANHVKWVKGASTVYGSGNREYIIPGVCNYMGVQYRVHYEGGLVAQVERIAVLPDDYDDMPESGKLRELPQAPDETQFNNDEYGSW